MRPRQTGPALAHNDNAEQKLGMGYSTADTVFDCIGFAGGLVLALSVLPQVCARCLHQFCSSSTSSGLGVPALRLHLRNEKVPPGVKQCVRAHAASDTPSFFGGVSRWSRTVVIRVVSGIQCYLPTRAIRYFHS